MSLGLVPHRENALAFALNDTSENIPDDPMFELLDGPDDVLGRSLTEERSRFVTLCVLEAGGVRVPSPAARMMTAAGRGDVTGEELPAMDVRGCGPS